MIFESTSVFHLTEERSVSRWLNKQHTGEETISFQSSVDEPLKKAHYAVRASREIRIIFEVDKEGEWKPLGLKMDGRSYDLRLIR